MRTGPGSAQRAWLARGFLGAILTWLLLLVLVPLLLAHDTGGRGVTMAAAGTYLVGSVICHQRPDRSFHIWGVQMPVCARCAGLYLGAAVGALLAGARRVSLTRLRRPAVQPCPADQARRGRIPAVTVVMASPVVRVIVLVAAVPTAVTWLGEAVGWLPFAGGVRAVAAVPLGAAVTWVASLVIRGELA